MNAFHAGMQPPGTVALPAKSTFALDTPIDETAYAPREPVKGVLLGEFGPSKTKAEGASHVLVVNLDYKAERTVSVSGPAPLEIFDAATGK